MGFEGRDQFRVVDLAGTHGHKVVAAALEQSLDGLFGVLDEANGGDCVDSHAGSYHKRLRICIADAADSGAAAEIPKSGRECFQ